MNCSQFLASLHEYFLKELPAERVETVEDHAAGCPECGDLFARCKEITCREVIDFLNDYVDGGLDPEQRAVFERHFALCSDCRNYLESYRSTMRLSALAVRKDEQSVLHAMPEELVRAIVEAQRRARR